MSRVSLRRSREPRCDPSPPHRAPAATRLDSRGGRAARPWWVALMGRQPGEWVLRRTSDTAPWQVRFIARGKRVELSTKERDKTAAIAVAQRLYAEYTGHPAPKRAVGIPIPATDGVYVIQGAGGYIKIGWAKNIARRVKELQTGHPEALRLLTVIAGDLYTESELHRRLSAHRALGEWFYPTPTVLSTVMCSASCESLVPLCAGTPKRGGSAR
jgi:hypothetical protein